MQNPNALIYMFLENYDMIKLNVVIHDDIDKLWYWSA